jgi:hypothetical protein
MSSEATQIEDELNVMQNLMHNLTEVMVYDISAMMRNGSWTYLAKRTCPVVGLLRVNKVSVLKQLIGKYSLIFKKICLKSLKTFEHS